MSPNREAWIWIEKARSVWPPDIEKILEYYKKAEDISPNYNNIYGDKATLFHALGEFAEAVKNYDLEIDAHNKRYAGTNLSGQIDQRVLKRKKQALDKYLPFPVLDTNPEPKPRLNNGNPIWNCSFICDHGLDEWRLSRRFKSSPNYFYFRSAFFEHDFVLTPGYVYPWESHIGYLLHKNLINDPNQKRMIENVSDDRNPFVELATTIFDEKKLVSMSDWAKLFGFYVTMLQISSVVVFVLMDYFHNGQVFFDSIIEKDVVDMQNKLKDRSTLDEKEITTLTQKLKLLNIMVNSFSEMEIDYVHPYFKLKIPHVIKIGIHYTRFFIIKNQSVFPFRTRSLHIRELLNSLKERILKNEDGIVNLVKNTKTYEDFEILFEKKILVKENEKSVSNPSGSKIGVDFSSTRILSELSNNS